MASPLRSRGAPGEGCYAGRRGGGAGGVKPARRAGGRVGGDKPARWAGGVETGAFGTLLRDRRLDAGLTQGALAERAGISARAVSDLERGINRAPRPDTLDLLAGALALTPGEQAAPGRAPAATPAPAPGRRRPRLAHGAPCRRLTSFVGREGELAAVRARLLRAGCAC